MALSETSARLVVLAVTGCRSRCGSMPLLNPPDAEPLITVRVEHVGDGARHVRTERWTPARAPAWRSVLLISRRLARSAFGRERHEPSGEPACRASTVASAMMPAPAAG